MKASEVVGKIVKSNNDFVKKHDRDYFAPHMTSQHPIITLISCSDSRVQPNVILPDAINKIFVIENIGNQILPSEGSIDYSIYHLHTPVLLILGHSDCGAINAFMKGYEQEPESIKKALNYLPQALSTYNQESDFEKDLLHNIQKNVDYQVDIAVRKYNILIREEKLTVIGAFYDFKNDLGRGYGKVLIINVNGEIHKNKIENLSIFEHIGGELKDISISRV